MRNELDLLKDNLGVVAEQKKTNERLGRETWILQAQLVDQKKEIEELRADSFYDEMMRQKAEIEDLQHDKAVSVRVLSFYTVENAKLKAEFNSLEAILDRLRQALPGNV